MFSSPFATPAFPIESRLPAQVSDAGRPGVVGNMLGVMVMLSTRVAPFGPALLFLAVAACSSGERAEPATEPASATTSEPDAPTTSEPVPVATANLAQTPDFHPTEPGLDHLLAVPGWDIGTGFVRIPPSPDGPPGTAPPDTFMIFGDPGTDAAPVARAFHRDYRLVLEATEEGLRDGALEVGYEERALPILRSGPNGRWLEVSFAFGSEGEPRTGWVDGGDPRLEQRSWDTWLETQGALFFFDSDSIAFFTAPNGPGLELTLEPAVGTLRYDYAMYPMATPESVRGAWMEVRITSPSDHCSEPDSAREERVWIRHLDDRGRPRVWYHTRGC